MPNFDEYIRNGEPDKKERASAWKTAIGLQAVDGLQTSDYLKDTAVKHIEGDISIDEVKALINGYYQSKTVRTPNDEDTEEADKVSANIARILNEKSFAFSVTGFTSIHRRLFEGVFKFAGKIRDYDITKKEWVLRGDTVLYVNAEDCDFVGGVLYFLSACSCQCDVFKRLRLNKSFGNRVKEVDSKAFYCVFFFRTFFSYA